MELSNPDYIPHSILTNAERWTILEVIGFIERMENWSDVTEDVNDDAETWHDVGFKQSPPSNVVIDTLNNLLNRDFAAWLENGRKEDASHL